MKTTEIKLELQEWMGGDRSIAETAWTSSSELQKKIARPSEDVERLVKMCARDGHGTPFESVVMRFWMRIPIIIDRQHMTHRIASHNGMSGRYRTMPSDFFDVPKDVQAIMSKIDPAWARFNIQRYRDACEETNAFYRDNLEKGKDAKKNGLITNNEYKRFREIIRGPLPQANMTERVTTMNLRSVCNYLKLRLSEHAQDEIRFVADRILSEIKDKNVCPIAIEELEKNGWQV